jgi:hypothetical protein
MQESKHRMTCERHAHLHNGCLTYLTCLQIVCDYILNGGDKAAFMERFKKAVSPGFDPETKLVKVGEGRNCKAYSLSPQQPSSWRLQFLASQALCCT